MNQPVTYAHIFLVTGPDPVLAEEYEKLGDFVRTLNDSLLSWNLYFMLHLCRGEEHAAEELAAAVAAAQEPEKQLYLFIFHEAAALSAQNALTDAIRQLRGGKKLNILVFFRRGEEAAHLEEFKKSLVEDFGHYASEYEHIDSIKLRLLTSLDSLGLDYLPLRCKDGEISLGSEGLLDVAEMPVFALHPRLAELKAEKALLEPRYREMHERYVNHDETLAPSEYEEIAKQYFVVLEQIPQVEKALLEELQKQTEIVSGERVSPLLARFYQYKEQGKYEEADRLLGYRDLALRKEARKLENARNRLENSLLIGEFLAKAELQKEFPASPEHLATAEQCYRDAVELAEDVNVRLDALAKFAEWLYDQNRYTEARELMERFWKSDEFTQAGKPMKAEYCNIMGLILAGLNDIRAEAFYREALDIQRALAERNPDAYRPALANICNNLGAFYQTNGQPAKAEALYQEALGIWHALAERKPDAFLPDLASSCDYLGYFYAVNGRPAEAEALYREALDIQRALAERNPDAFLPDLASSYNYLGYFYADNGQPAKAEALYQEALGIWHALAERNPDAFLPYLASSCNNLGYFYADNGHPEMAEALHQEALDIRRELAERNPDAYRPALANICNNLGAFYQTNGHPEMAEALHQEALDIRRELAERNPDAYRPYLATSCNNLGNFYKNNGQPEKAEALYREALVIRRALAQNTPKAYTGDLADTEYNLFAFYRSSDMEKALSFLQQAHDHYAYMAPHNVHCADYAKRTAFLLNILR